MTPHPQPSDLFDLEAFEAAAEARMSQAARDLIQEGAGAGRGMVANRAAWSRWALRTRVLRDVSHIDLATTVLGEPVSMPIMIAPSGLHGLTHADAEAATARAARAGGVLMVLSLNASLSVEAVAREGAALWLQLYWGRDRDFVADMVSRAEGAGCKALCLTLDFPVRPWIRGPLRRSLAAIGDLQPAHGFPRAGHLGAALPWDHDATLTWKDLDWLRRRTSLPLVLKGIMSGQDARRAADAGAAAVIVSNHGGRVLEEGLATAEALPEVVEAAAGRLEVLVDGGIRSGADVVRALALGARAVLVGRPALWGLAVGGEAGLTRILDLLRGETESIMGMMGAAGCRDITRDSVTFRTPAARDTA